MSTTPVAIIRCGAPEALRHEQDPDESLIPENQNGLPCSGGFHPFLGCVHCAFCQVADGDLDEHWGDVGVREDFQGSPGLAER